MKPSRFGMRTAASDFGVHVASAAMTSAARQDVGAERIHLVVAEAVGRGERHRPLDVVEERRRVRPVALDRLHRRLRRVAVDERAAAADQAVTEAALQVVAVAGEALRFVDRLALRDRARALRQAAAVGQRRKEARQLDWRCGPAEAVACVLRRCRSAPSRGDARHAEQHGAPRACGRAGTRSVVVDIVTFPSLATCQLWIAFR